MEKKINTVIAKQPMMKYLIQIQYILKTFAMNMKEICMKKHFVRQYKVFRQLSALCNRC